jgi:peptide/nickel transport system permease protein
VTRYVLRRLLVAVPLLLGIATLIFFVVSLAPGDPTLFMISPGMTAEVVQHMRTNFGLDDPVYLRYLKWMVAFFTGDFGYSWSHSAPVAQVLLDFLPNTLLLSGCALLVSFAAGIVLGTLQAVRRNGAVDSALSVILLFFYSMPSFWLALMLILVFSLFARNLWHWPIWFPASGMYPVGYQSLDAGAKILARARHLFLPVLSLSLVLTAGIARYMRGSMLEVVDQDFIRTARAKGLPERTVIFKHALRNALLPVITVLGLYIPVLFSGTVFIEYVFAWPGMGKTLVDAINARDYPLVMAASFLFAVMVVLGNLLADVLYAVVDPRIRYE